MHVVMSSQPVYYSNVESVLSASSAFLRFVRYVPIYFRQSSINRRPLATDEAS